MNDRRRLTYLIGLMVLLAISVTGVSTFAFYDAYFEQQRARLTELAKSQARLMEAVARFDQAHSEDDHIDGASGATLSQIKEAHSKFEGFGETGEFVLAHKGPEKINWLSKRRHEESAINDFTAYTDMIAEPMVRALDGEQGSLVGLDYRGVTVLAAYEPVAILNLGIVAKIDLSEIRAPFLQSGAIFSIIGIFLVLFTGYLFRRIGSPVIQHLETALEDLKTSYDQQETLIGERTAELNSELTMRRMIEKSLVQAKTEADTANRSKSQFLANMSHELRTPLNSIIGFSEILKDEMFGPLKNEKYKDYASDINHSGSHLLSLINDVLDVSKIEAGALALEDEIFDPRNPLAESARMVAERASSAGIRMSFHTSENLPFLIADEIRVKQMILNLLTNSIKFTPKGGHVQASIRGQLGSELEIEVADNGVGIAEEDMEQVMQPFGQARQDASLKSEDGTGLGIPLIKMLIELHGGTMELTSNKGEGTRVILRFPKERTTKPV